MTSKVCHLLPAAAKIPSVFSAFVLWELQRTEAWPLAGGVPCDYFVQGSPADYHSASVFSHLMNRVLSSCEDCKKEPEGLDQALQRQTLEWGSTAEFEHESWGERRSKSRHLGAKVHFV